MRNFLYVASDYGDMTPPPLPPVDEFTIDMLTVHGQFASGSGWLDEASIRDVIFKNLTFPLSSSLSSGGLNIESYTYSIDSNTTDDVYDEAEVTVNGKAYRFPLTRYNTWSFDTIYTTEELPGLALVVHVTNVSAMGTLIYLSAVREDEAQSILDTIRRR